MRIAWISIVLWLLLAACAPDASLSSGEGDGPADADPIAEAVPGNEQGDSGTIGPQGAASDVASDPEILVPGDEPPGDARGSEEVGVKQSPERVPPPSEDGATVGEVPAEYLGEVLAHAAGHSGVAEAELAVSRAEFVVWPDGSMGCGEIGGNYTAAPVEGYWVVLLAGSEELDYRMNLDGVFMLCDQPGAPPNAGVTG